MYTKCTLIFEMLKVACALYELRHQGPNKICELLDRYNAVCASEEASDLIEEWGGFTHGGKASAMAKEYLEFVYTGAAEPEWILQAESRAAKSQ